MKMLKAIATITIFTMLTRLLGFVLRIFLSRELGAEGMGVYQVAFSAFIVLLTLTSSGVPLIISRQTAKYTELNQRNRVHSAVSSALLFGTIFSITISGIILLLRKQIAGFFPSESGLNTLLVLLPAVIASGIYSGFHGALWGEKRYFLSSFNEFLEQVVRIFLCIFLFKFTKIDKLIATGLSLSIACVISMLMGIILYFYYGGKLRKFDRELIPLIKSSAPITGIRLSGSVINSFISIILPLRLMAGGMSNPEALSTLGCIVGMAFPLLYLPNTFIGALASVLVPELSGSSSKDAQRRKVESSITISVLVAVLFIPLFIGLGNELGVLVYDSAEAGKYISQCGILMLPMAIEQIASSMMNSLDLEIQGFVNFLAGSIVMILFVVVLTPYIGTMAYISGMFLQLTLSALLDIFSIKKKIGIKFTFIKPMLIAGALMVPVTALCMSLTSLMQSLPLAVNLILSGIISFSAMVLLCMCFKLFDMAGVYIRKPKSIQKNIKEAQV